MERDLHKRLKALQREEAKEQGFYDGRFKTRSVDSRKLRSEKRYSQKRVRNFYEEDMD